MKDTIISEKKEKTFDDFVIEYFKEENILKDDLNKLNEKEFHLKYKIRKNDLHTNCTIEFKKRYPKDYDRILKTYKEKQKKIFEEQREKRNKIVETRKKELIEILMRQTEFTKEEAIKTLEETKYDITEAIKKYMSCKNTDICEKDTENISTNQKIFKEIRSFMDKGCAEYERKKEFQEKLKAMKKNELIENE